MSRVNEYVQELQGEWSAAQLMANLSYLDQVDAEKIQPATEVANTLFNEATLQVDKEHARLQALRKIHTIAEHSNVLMQSQVGHSILSDFEIVRLTKVLITTVTNV